MYFSQTSPSAPAVGSAVEMVVFRNPDEPVAVGEVTVVTVPTVVML